MAEGKKTFIFYSDWINMVREMPNEDAGELLKHILSYVNDENPETKNILVKMAFGHMMPILKRDLKKWETQLKTYSEMGKKSAEKRALNQEQPKSTYVEPTPTVNDNDNDNDNVNVNENDFENKKKEKEVFNFRKSLIDSGGEIKLVEDWLKVRKTKKATNTETALEGFINEVLKSKKGINDILKICIERDWKGFKNSWLENDIKSSPEARRSAVERMLNQRGR